MSGADVGGAAEIDPIDAESARARRALIGAQVAAPGETELADVAERVARAVAEAESERVRGAVADRFRDRMAAGEFLPSVPILANAGRGGQLAACFALELEDSLDSIYGALHRAARIQQGSGGVGIELSALRPRGTPIERSGGHTPGPVAFAELFARSAHVMGLAGRRAGAHLAILRDDHPDVVELVRAGRETPERFPQLGLAVGLSDRLLGAAARGEAFALQHPRGGRRTIDAQGLLEEIARSILASGNPTLLFVDRIQADNPTPGLGRLRATNPCGEQPLLSGESCVLGSIVLPRFRTARGGIDDVRLAAVVRDAIRFLDDAIEVNAWPDEGVAAASRRTRKVGLGVMGLADLLLEQGLAYDEAAGRTLAGRVLDVVAREAEAASEALAAERGVYPGHERGPRRRNACTRAIAPTGTIALLAGCSSGIEPFLAPRVELRTGSGPRIWTDVWLASWLRRHGFDPSADWPESAVSRSGTASAGSDTSLRRLLRRAWEISPEDQIAMQAVVQQRVDGAVSKTVLLDPRSRPTPADVVAWIRLAHRLGCKGVAFFHPDASSVASASIDLCAARGAACPD